MTDHLHLDLSDLPTKLTRPRQQLMFAITQYGDDGGLSMAHQILPASDKGE